MLKRNSFAALRLIAFSGLLAALGVRLANGDRSIDSLVFLAVVPLWFGTTLALGFLRPPSARPLLFRNMLYAMMDAYLIMMASAAVAGTGRHPFVFLGAYVFLASALGGPAVGAACATSGFLGLVNGWLLPTGELHLRTLLAGGGTALASAVCGAAWRLGLPALAKALAAPQSATGEVVHDRAESLDEMEKRLREISAERDQAQERLHELELKRGEEAESGATERVADSNTALEDPDTTIRRLETELENSRSEKTALMIDKQRLTEEVSELSKELMAMYSQSPETDSQKMQGDPKHADG